MSTVMNQANDPAQAPHHRRSREEVEALAKNFVGTPAEGEAPARNPRMLMIGGGAAAAILVVVVALIAWPQSDDTAKVAPGTSSRAAAEAEQWKQRYEAERERKRKELEAGKDYLSRIAAADSELMKDMTAQADRLAARQAALSSAPAAADAPPSPRESSATPTKPAATTTAPATTAGTQPKTAAPAPTQQASAAPAPAQETKAAPAQAAPTQVAQAPASSCAIHVSELSSSGKLTYEAVKKMKGARVDASTGHVFTPPVQAAGGRTVVFEVMPDGCVRVGRR